GISTTASIQCRRCGRNARHWQSKFSRGCSLRSGQPHILAGHFLATAFFTPRGFIDVDAKHKPAPARHGELTGTGCRDLPAAILLSGIICRNPAMTEFDPAAHRMVSEQRWF